MKKATIPYFRPDIRRSEIDEVVTALRSGWLTTGPRVKRFEEDFRGRQWAAGMRSRSTRAPRPSTSPSRPSACKPDRPSSCRR